MRIFASFPSVFPAVDSHVLDRFYDIFVNMDKDNTGEVDLDEFYRFFGLERSSFADRVFSIMGKPIQRFCLLFISFLRMINELDSSFLLSLFHQ